MKKAYLLASAALAAIALLGVSAFAEEPQGNEVSADTYGIYSMEGDAVDSAIRCHLVYDLDQEKIVSVDFDEALLPFSMGGAAGWALLGEEEASALGEAALTVKSGSYAPAFQLGDLLWTGKLKDDTVVYETEMDGETTDFLTYVGTQEGGAWYYDTYEAGATLLDGEGNEVGQVEIGTKESIGHGVDFWMSPITFPGNIDLIEEFLVANGTDFDYAPNEAIAKNDEGVWTVADAVTGATLAGTPNYLNLAKLAVEEIQAGEYTTAE